jgi:hypothetical protein
MSDQSKDHNAVIIEIANRLKQRKCRGVRAAGAGFEAPEKITATGEAGQSFVPDITSQIPSYIIAVEDSSSLNNAGAAWSVFSAHARKTYREFIVAVPRSCGDEARAKAKEMKIRNVKFLWY